MYLLYNPTSQSARPPNLQSPTQLVFLIPMKANLKLTTQLYHASRWLPSKRWNLKPNCSVLRFARLYSCYVSEVYTVSVRLQRSKCLSLPSAVGLYSYNSIVFTDGHKKRDVKVFACSQCGRSVSRGGPRQ